MSFNALPNSTSTRILAGDAFYPPIQVGEFMQDYRLPAEYAESLIADHLQLAMFWAQKQLRQWRQAHEAQGNSSLTAVGESALLLYRRAVFCHAKALLLGQFITTDRRDAAKNEGKEGEAVANRFHAWAQDALADLLERGRIDVELV